MRALVSWQMPRRSLRAYIPKATNVVDEGASIACDVTAVVIRSCPLGGGLDRRVLGARVESLGIPVRGFRITSAGVRRKVPDAGSGLSRLTPGVGL